jgi:hypothetical protein
MSDRDLDAWLGTTGRDPGCDAGLDFIDAYCDLLYRGDPVPDRFQDFVTHLTNCTACREDTEALLAALRELDDPGTR